MDIRSQHAEVDGVRLHWREAGDGDPVLLLHGWPTSSFLWRNVMPAIAATHRVIALDLPGFGQSDKPLGPAYRFGFYEHLLDGFLRELGLQRLGLAVHDLGGPIGAYWAVLRPERVTRIAFLNTLLFPPLHWTVYAFVLSARLPVVRTWLASPAGLRFTMRFGMQDKARATDPAMLEGVLEPFREVPARQALLKAAAELNPGGFRRIRDHLEALTCPVLCLYGEGDRILPDVAKTMSRVAVMLPQAQVMPLPGCGHFLQEDLPDVVGQRLAAFFADSGVEPPMARTGNPP